MAITSLLEAASKRLLRFSGDGYSSTNLAKVRGLGARRHPRKGDSLPSVEAYNGGNVAIELQSLQLKIIQLRLIALSKEILSRQVL